MNRREKEPHHHSVKGTRLSDRHKALLYGAVAVLWLSGLVWVVLHRFGIQEGEFGPATSPVEPLMLKVHGAAAIAFTLVLGALVPVHMRRGWALRRNQSSGIIIVSTCALLVVTGWGLYYISGDNLRAATSLCHWVLGLLLPLVVYFHILAWRLATRRRKGATA